MVDVLRNQLLVPFMVIKYKSRFVLYLSLSSQLVETDLNSTQLSKGCNTKLPTRLAGEVSDQMID